MRWHRVGNASIQQVAHVSRTESSPTTMATTTREVYHRKGEDSLLQLTTTPAAHRTQHPADHHLCMGVCFCMLRVGFGSMTQI